MASGLSNKLEPKQTILIRSLDEWSRLVNDLNTAWGQSFAVVDTAIERVEVAESIRTMLQAVHDLAWYTLEELQKEKEDMENGVHIR
jgi:hypothetical protein